MYKKHLTAEQALQKIKHYCAYQERCHSEVIDKLYALGVWKKDHDQILSQLIEENYLNEERFAIAYAGGKFRVNNWGRIKIKIALKQKNISDYLVKKSLKQIDDESYLGTIEKIARQKYGSLKGDQYLIRKKKTIDHLLQKGFELPLVTSVVEGLTK